MGNHSQIVHCTGMSRVAGEDLPVKLLRLAKAARLVVLNRQSEGLLDRQLGHRI